MLLFNVFTNLIPDTDILFFNEKLICISMFFRLLSIISGGKYSVYSTLLFVVFIVAGLFFFLYSGFTPKYMYLIYSAGIVILSLVNFDWIFKYLLMASAIASVILLGLYYSSMI
ncbi:hypothetical protein K7I13_14370 [Brucepastera parasyntrophica]|uniref:hypothetical protein n=1 Tax=Brucepastera parasyntrophica TaxID=2880008 RepID=UPI00210C782D|nr:hypothetical protein [Brucepastera parasyntrophica]ULQ59626.1 hypothetical protein K7I13_14370 [Brucepastera parasyntrophica]